MARKTKDELISDIELRLTQSIPSDDFEVEREQIAHWLDLASNSIVSDLLTNQIRRSGDIDPFYLLSTDLKNVSKENTSGILSDSIRYYIDISDIDVLSIPSESGDRGVYLVKNKSNKILPYIREQDVQWMKDLWFSTPSKNNPMWFRENDKVFIVGLSDKDYNQSKFRITYVPVIDSSSLNNEDEYPVTSDVLPMISDLAYENGIKELNEGELDLQNDGKPE